MTMEMIRDVLAWCSVIDIGVLMLWFLFFVGAHDLVYRIHGAFFNLTVEEFDAIHYKAMAVFKMGFLLFHLVPYLAMRIVV
jgi:hypothetical protein